MTTEQYLEQVYTQTKEKEELMKDIDRLQPKYDRACEPGRYVNYDIVIQQSRVNKSPTETAALKRAELAEDLAHIHTQIAGCRAIIDDVLDTVRKAGLTCDENEYIKLRYYKQMSAELTEKTMHRTHTHRLRKTALEKIEKARKKP